MSAIYFIRTRILPRSGIRSIALYGDGGIEVGVARDIFSVFIFTANQINGTRFVLSFQTLIGRHTIHIIFLWISRIVGQINLHTIGIATDTIVIGICIEREFNC